MVKDAKVLVAAVLAVILVQALFAADLTKTTLDLTSHYYSGTTTSSSGSSASGIPQQYEKALIESDGFFTDVSESDWILLKNRSAAQEQFYSAQFANGGVTDPAQFYQNSYEPDFTCLGERRIGGLGDGPKWVCDPHRIGTGAAAAAALPPPPSSDEEEEGTTASGGGSSGAKHKPSSPCLIYSIGSAGKVEFEKGVRNDIASGRCEVHVFDVTGYNKRNGNFAEKTASVGATFHQWGIETEANAKGNPSLKTLAETVTLLNHTGRELDIFKIDCEGCEWHTYVDWFNSGVTMRQILVEVHGVKVPETLDFFKRLRDEHYHIFHKEANVIAKPCAEPWEYAFIRLSPLF